MDNSSLTALVANAMILAINATKEAKTCEPNIYWEAAGPVAAALVLAALKDTSGSDIKNSLV